MDLDRNGGNVWRETNLSLSLLLSSPLLSPYEKPLMIRSCVTSVPQIILTMTGRGRGRERPRDRRFQQIIEIFNATSDGTPADLQRCIDSGYPLDAPMPRAPSLSTPINIAAQYRRAENLAILATKALEAGRPELLEAPDLSRLRHPRKLNPEGRSLAYIAVQKGCPVCLGVMAKAGANPHRAIPHAWQPMVNNPGEHLIDADKECCPVHHALVQTVLSFTTKTCMACSKNAAEPKLDVLKVCSQCKMGYFCNETCQRKSWREHKKVCKGIRQGSDMITFYDQMPPQRQYDETGFLSFDEAFDNDLGDQEDDYDATNQWEYYDLKTESWKPYPKLINYGIQGILDLGMSPRYMYKLGNDDAMGNEEYGLSSNPPDEVATNHVYYCHNIDHSIYTGCGRRIRRRKLG